MFSTLSQRKNLALISSLSILFFQVTIIETNKASKTPEKDKQRPEKLVFQRQEIYFSTASRQTKQMHGYERRSKHH